jgi:hypothetical protein
MSRTFRRPRPRILYDYSSASAAGAANEEIFDLRFLICDLSFALEEVRQRRRHVNRKSKI